MVSAYPAHVGKLFIIAAAVVLLVLAISVFASANDPDPVVALYLRGRIDSLETLNAQGAWAGTARGELLTAIVERNGDEAFSRFERLVQRDDTPADIRTVAWFHLLGYYLLVTDSDLIAESLEQLRMNPSLAKKLFHGSIPTPGELVAPSAAEEPPRFYALSAPSAEKGTGEAPPVPLNLPYSVQVGAFSVRERAEAFAEQVRRNEQWVRIEELHRTEKTLYAVLVGRFADCEEASRYGARRFGKEGVDFTVVKQ